METKERVKCASPALVRYTWPGRDEAYACAIHALAIERVALAIGLHLQLIRLTPEQMGEASCSSED